MNQAKSFAITLAFAVSVLVLAVSLLNISGMSNIAGRASYQPLQLFGTITPGLPDGTEISFNVGDLEVVTTTLTNNAYGYEEDMLFIMDDVGTLEKEGYRRGDTVTVYIEDVEIAEVSYFKGIAIRKDIVIPPSVRGEVTTKAALASLERNCIPTWQCSVWGSCDANVKTRECIDMNNCDSIEGRPAERARCSMPSPVEQTSVQEKESPWGMLLILLFLFFVLGFAVDTIKKAKSTGKKRK